MKAEEKAQAIAEWHKKWAKKWADSVEVDPLYTNNNPSQYPETIIDMSASQEAQDEYWDEVFRITGRRRYRGK